MKKIKKAIIITMIMSSFGLSSTSYAFISNNMGTNSPITLTADANNNATTNNNSTNSTTATPSNNAGAAVNQGATNAKEFMSNLTAEIGALFNKYGNSGYPLLNKAIQVIKIILTYVLRTIEDILVLIHDLLKVVTN